MSSFGRMMNRFGSRPHAPRRRQVRVRVSRVALGEDDLNRNREKHQL